MPEIRMPKCLIAACAKPSAPALKRGLCMGCHSQAKKRVEAGLTNWDRLVGLGLALSINDDPFSRAFDKAVKREGEV